MGSFRPAIHGPVPSAASYSHIREGRSYLSRPDPGVFAPANGKDGSRDIRNQVLDEHPWEKRLCACFSGRSTQRSSVPSGTDRPPNHGSVGGPAGRGPPPTFRCLAVYLTPAVLAPRPASWWRGTFPLISSRLIRFYRARGLQTEPGLRSAARVTLLQGAVGRHARPPQLFALSTRSIQRLSLAIPC
jgi:hypothetical protein